jgi:ATPase subunit of ABC transporter with duplicated ATPase domains
LRESLDAFAYLKLESMGGKSRMLAADFDQTGGQTIKFYLNELSEGQRCLICLYTILHFLLAKGSTVILDEPDNFVSLREIQPWLTAVADAIEDGHGQMLIVSHHPELIDLWAPESGVKFVRDGVGPVRAIEFRGDPESPLSASELVARGWDHD